ncbi:MAG TPA: sulfatase-like hydrolase/transferase [Verrucomicrobiae bacterium]|jgi:choline-sulfatase|nr:sulfatase-like hydrolase/transferase [Verrucomicrobiae bacterium]
MIDRREFLKKAGGLAVGGLSASALLSPMELAAAGEMSAPRKKPNFVVIVADDQCYRTLNALNNKEVRTPNFDRLMARGTTFTHCFHQGSWTGAVCIASRAMMHTGRYLWTCGGASCGNYPLLGETLQKNGYHTCAVGKWHNGDATALRSFRTGKSVAPGFLASTPVKVNGHFGLAYNRPRPGDPWTPWDPKYRGQWTPGQLWDIENSEAGAHYEIHQHSCELYADNAIKLLQQLSKQPDNPFFLYLAWNAPHDPRQAPKEIVDSYPADKIEVPPNFLPRHPFDIGENGRGEELAPFPRTPEVVQVHRQEYYALTTYMDQQMGRVLDALEKSDQADNTYIIVTGDHGLAVGEHGVMGKQNMYECSVRMPFIMSGPGIAAGKQIDAKMYQHCLFATMCELAGIPTPSTVQFPSLMPLLRGERQQLFDSMYCAYLKVQRSVRTDTHKLILYPKVKQVQLFDIVNDPWEVRNLAGDTANAEKISELFGDLKKLQATISDTLVLDPEVFGIKA